MTAAQGEHGPHAARGGARAVIARGLGRMWAHVADARRVWAVTLALAAAGLALQTGPLADAGRPVDSFHLPWWSLAAMFLLAELHTVHLRFGTDSQSFSLSEVAVVLGLFFATPGELVLGQLVGSTAALALHRRQPPHKLAFNLALFGLGTSLAGAVFHALVAPGDALGPAAWASALGTAAVADTVTFAILTGAIAFFTGGFERGGLAVSLGFGLIGTLTNTCLALFGVTILATDPRAAWLLAVPVAAVAFAYRAYTREQERLARVTTLHQAMDVVQGGAPDVEPGVIGLLGEARKIFRTEIAEITLLPRTSDDRPLRTTMGPGDRLTVSSPDALTPVEQGMLDAVAERRSLYVTGARAPGLLAEWLHHRGYADAMVTSLRDGARPLGMLLVADRARGIMTFAAEELVFLETFAGAAAVSLQNGRLEESLTKLTEVKEHYRHEAFHDPLTQLANRALFAERLQRALDRRVGTGREVAVLFIDLDDFKSVNDSKGHAAGDRVLMAVARRIGQVLDADDTAARLGGDEFAVLLEQIEDPGHPSEVAERLITALAAPIDIGAQEVSVGASVGVACTAGTDMSVDDVLRDADVAMYSAKGAGKGRHVVFEAGRHASVLERHDLTLDLRVAGEREEFFTVFQPLVDLADGRVVAVETLVRWRHPERGLVPPDEFIGLAEQLGLMVPLGRFVLEDACRRAAAWRQIPGCGDVAVTVNVSARQLHEDGFIADVDRILQATGLNPRGLVLEVTESVAMQDPMLAQRRLEALSGLGLRLAVDDFGTGYSSLARLRDFPLDMLKIAKPFVDDLGRGPDEAMVAGLVIRLAEALQLDVVAEGIESAEQAACLRSLGCRIGQGYHFHRPLAPDALYELLARPQDGLGALAA